MSIYYISCLHLFIYMLFIILFSATFYFGSVLFPVVVHALKITKEHKRSPVRTILKCFNEACEHKGSKGLPEPAKYCIECDYLVLVQIFCFLANKGGSSLQSCDSCVLKCSVESKHTIVAKEEVAFFFYHYHMGIFLFIFYYNG